MGYQDGFGLRPGRTKEKMDATDRGGVGTAFSPSAGYRAAGAVSPVMQEERKLTPGSERSALGQFNAEGPKVPEAPGLLKTIGTSAASAAGGKVLERGVDKVADSTIGRAATHLMSGSSIPFSAIKSANASPDAIEYLDTRGYFDAPNYAPVSDAAGLGEYAVPGIGADGYIDALGDGVGIGADAAGAADAASGFGDVAPYAGSVIRLAQGDVKGAAGAAAGTFIGNMILPGVGGVVGGILGGGGCFITEATMAGLGVQDDDAEPLKVLRAFRDQVLASTPQGQQMIQEYEAIAPLVVAAVQSRPDAMTIFKSIYTQFIAPAVEAIKGGNYPQALQIYAAMIAAVVPFAQEAMDGMDDMGEGEMAEAGEVQEMQSLGDDAAEVAQNPQMAQQAAPMQGDMQGGALQQFNADEYPSPVRFGRR